ncbi:hypothetical protein [Bathymodiolus thermophilus thioautotrophic gill symbiont]|uniref:hypothetical protein n=1 Tax=Bathymodiolus thermophilus thioautotrophic gill symbiont TaxID=2360 RepID=UPI00130196AD|nr:hypothetical protein [Bathymodiolus thermophilus thioautotrophic gill symbiont]
MNVKTLSSGEVDKNQCKNIEKLQASGLDFRVVLAVTITQIYCGVTNKADMIPFSKIK